MQIIFFHSSNPCYEYLSGHPNIHTNILENVSWEVQASLPMFKCWTCYFCDFELYLFLKFVFGNFVKIELSINIF